MKIEKKKSSGEYKRKLENENKYVIHQLRTQENIIFHLLKKR